MGPSINGFLGEKYSAASFGDVWAQGFCFRVCVPLGMCTLYQNIIRCILLIMMTVCAGGVIVVENPGTSLIYLHDRWQWMLQRLGSAKIPAPLINSSRYEINTSR